jgi:hypothetical protein
MVTERYDHGCDNEADRHALPAATRMGMSETTYAHDEVHRALPGDAPQADAHGEAAHEDAPHDDHSHGTQLGPIDWPAWGAGLLGIAAGLVVAACLYISTSV